MTRRPAAPVFRSLDALADALRDTGAKRVVLANGCFDPLHVGHVRYLWDARAHGDFLLVAVNDDAGARRLKGDGRPAVGEDDRAAIIAALRCVDAVLVFGRENAGDDNVAVVLEHIRPAVHAKGTDYTVDTVPEREVAKRLGIETVITGDAKSHASRVIVERVRARGGDGPPAA
jgi:rfaE bifunctional protein nucleotidyltransferase chain/domain